EQVHRNHTRFGQYLPSQRVRRPAYISIGDEHPERTRRAGWASCRCCRWRPRGRVSGCCCCCRRMSCCWCCSWSCCSAWRCRGRWRRSSAATDRLNSGGATACGAATYCKPTSIEQRGSRSLVIYGVRRPGSPAIGARIVYPHLLVDRQTKAADDPQFIVQDEPVIALARPARCWQYGDSTPDVGGRVVSVLCAWRSPAAYHVDLAIEQHACHVALARGHRRPGSVGVRPRVIDVYIR